MTTTALATADAPVIVIDLGGQYARLIARRIRELGARSILVQRTATAADIEAMKPAAIILSGGPASVYEDAAPTIDAGILDLEIPTLGICYGMQLMAKLLGGNVEQTGTAEFGRTDLQIAPNSGALLVGIERDQTVWMSHRDAVAAAPAGALVTASTPATGVAAFEHSERRMYAVQFHPEVVHTPAGNRMLQRFLFDISETSRTWTPDAIIEEQIEAIRAQVGDTGHAVCALSGGVDSSVAAMLVHRAIGDRLTCVFVDHGLMRADEARQVVETFGNRFHVPLVHVDASNEFFELLAGVTDPEEKRKRIGEAFIRIFEREAARMGNADHLVQGTLYSDVIESGGEHGIAANIKSHHNVGGLPDDMQLDLVEPLRFLFKDEVRRVGEALGLPKELVWRQPFPGPGLAIRVLGEVTRERVEIVRAADTIVRHEISDAKLDDPPWQYFAVLPDVQSVGVQGDSRTYAAPIVIRAVTSDDAMTADWARLPHDLLARISSRIVNEVDGVNRVLLDVTSKPPGTIEWE
jgi:GMP synthase (glutamine-hydrolysing)